MSQSSNTHAFQMKNKAALKAKNDALELIQQNEKNLRFFMDNPDGIKYSLSGFFDAGCKPKLWPNYYY